MQNQEELVRNLANITAPEEDFTASATIEVRLSQGTVEVSLDTSDAIDLEAERKRLERALLRPKGTGSNWCETEQ